MELERRGAQEARRGKDIEQELTRQVIGCAMKVHSSLGPGLLEAVYEACLCRELAKSEIQFRRQVSLPVTYDGFQLDCGLRLDLLVEEKLIVEMKSVERLIPLHESQLFTYLRLSRMPIGLLLNFNVRHFRDGIRRLVLSPAR